MNKKTIIILGGSLLLIIIAMILVPAMVSYNKEENAAQELSELYDEEFVITKSTASDHFFGGAFDVTVQSLNTEGTYDFVINEDEYTGNYHGENVNIEINKLLEQRVDGLVMTNSHIEADEAISYQEAGIEQLDIRMLVNEAVPTATLDDMAALLKEKLGNVAINFEVFIVEDEEIYNGVVKEVSMYFQLSDITQDSFEDFPFEVEQYSY